MIFRQEFLKGIRSGKINVAYRRWKRPTVRAGGTLLTPFGQLSIRAVDEVDQAKITERQAKQAGFATREDLMAELDARREGLVYRIKLGELVPDPRIALRKSVPKKESDLNALHSKLTRLDRNSASGPWTLDVLKLIEKRPAVRAGDLCKVMRQERDDFKINVRKLKKLGLTESLEVGYKLSPRGKAVLKWIDR